MPGNSDTTPTPLARGRGFLHEVIVELKKTTWPTPREAWRLTVVVMAVVVAVAVYVGVLDYLLSTITNRLHLFK
jgi:preprotein translocase subunit SecE